MVARVTVVEPVVSEMEMDGELDAEGEPC